MYVSMQEAFKKGSHIQAIRPALLSVVLLAVSIYPAFGQGAGSLTVNCNAPGVELQTKIDNASPGSTVWITGNCDRGPYVVVRNIKIKGFGDNGATLSPLEGSSHVLVVSEGATLQDEDFHINGNGVTGILVRGSHLFANNIMIKTADTGVRVGVGSHATIQDCKFQNNSIFGIEVSESSGAILIGNTIENTSNAGIAVHHSSSAIVDGNAMVNNSYGIVVDSNASAMLLNSRIEACTGVGVIVQKSGFIDSGEPPNNTFIYLQ